MPRNDPTARAALANIRREEMRARGVEKGDKQPVVRDTYADELKDAKQEIEACSGL